ncbi:hypothetical protein [Nocardia otitidiscaviarum]|uniref:hypothetical protein n=1 Tax=Nocardia otitidiscaviarum TaxID=1823 RepID=UPI001895F3B6|nr:hypothetical protein [Nocardia otitidiscaviarum]MBF6177463.1 hypothetical protein [Nocardia otitidiscaviarum]
MRGAIGASALAGLAVALVAVTGCGDDSTSESSVTSSTTTSATSTRPATPLPGEPVQCGTGPWGLSVVVYTTKGPDFCAMALDVVNEYAAQRDSQPEGDIAVTVDNIRWVCAERQGDPNPYQECGSQNESADQIHLYS